MAEYVTANGVTMWYDDRGAGDPVVLLHGGLTEFLATGRTRSRQSPRPWSTTGRTSRSSRISIGRSSATVCLPGAGLSSDHRMCPRRSAG
jgi:hypothetical protein